MSTEENRETVLVLGAGSTVGGGFNVQIDGTVFLPPLDKNFFETPAVQHVFTEQTYPALSYYCQDSSLESTWAAVDLCHKLCRTGILSEETAYLELAAALDRQANGDHAYRVKLEQEDRRWCVPSMAGWESLHLIWRVFQALNHQNTLQSPLYAVVSRLLQQGLLGAITFNYDTSLELLFKDRFYYPILESQPTSVRLPLFKLHGSLNWRTNSRDESIAVVAPSQNLMEHGIQWFAQPEVVGPTFFKQEITLDLTAPDFRARYYRRLWSNAWDLLRRANNIIIVGFSFPRTDFHVAALFRAAHRASGGFHNIILCHKSDKNLSNNAKQVFDGRQGRTRFTEFSQGVEEMADRLEEVICLLQS